MEADVNLDEMMLEVVRNLVSNAITTAAVNVEKIIALTSSYLTSQAHEGLAQFHDLYFKQSADLDARKDAANRSVDDLIDAIQAGKEVADESAEVRIGLSAFQKRLESLITLEEGMRDKIAPVLSSMQFEDVMRQRMTHLLDGLSDLVEQLKESQPNFSEVADKIAKSLSSDSEREQYYRLVLNEKPPEGLQQTSIFLDFT